MSVKLEIKRALVLSTVAITGYSACLASIPMTQNIAVSVQSGGQGTDCPGSFTAYTYMTNSVNGSIWIPVPAGETNAVLTDISNYPAPYASVVTAMYRSNGETWCAGDSVSFPVVGGAQFQYKLFVVSGTVTNGQPLTLQVVYQP